MSSTCKFSLTNLIARAKTKKRTTHSVKNNSNFEFAALFHLLNGKGKSAAISKLELFLTEWSRSYFVFALNLRTSLKLLLCWKFHKSVRDNYKAIRWIVSFTSSIVILRLRTFLPFCLLLFKEARHSLWKVKISAHRPKKNTNKYLILTNWIVINENIRL